MHKNSLIFTVPFILVCMWGCTYTQTRQEDLALFTNPKTEKRVKYLQDTLMSNPGDSETRMELAKIFLSEESFGKAISELEKALVTDPGNVQAHLLLSSALQKRLKPDLTRAKKLLEEAVEIAPDNADAHLNLAHAYNKSGEKENAIKEFNKTLELSKSPAALVSAHLGLMAIYKKKGETEKADYSYEEARRIYPDVEKLIEQTEINRITPAPAYAGAELRGEDGIHPPHEERIKRLLKIRRMPEGED